MPDIVFLAEQRMATLIAHTRIMRKIECKGRTPERAAIELALAYQLDRLRKEMAQVQLGTGMQVPTDGAIGEEMRQRKLHSVQEEPELPLDREPREHKG